MNNLKTYSIIWSGTINPGASYVSQAFISNSNKEFKIKSITWDWRCRIELPPMTLIPIEQNTTQEIELSAISIPAGIMIADPFINAVPVINVAANGSQITFYKPGKRNFDNFFVQNEIDFMYTHINRDVLNVIRFYSSILVEIENL
jgi:hypothetical protein